METKIDYIIARVLSGEASSKDILYLSNWLNENEVHQKEFCELKNYWDAEISLEHSILPMLSMEKLQQKIEKQNKVAKRRRIKTYIIPLVASIALLLAISGSFILTQMKNTESKYYTYLTNNDKTDLTMEDGTQITLNKNSRLTYSDKYGKEMRSVQLEGEAYFNVTKDSLKPFRITMGNSTITVLGTSFNLKNEIKSSSITATLIEGSIYFETPEQKVLLKPGQQLSFNQQSNSLDIAHVDTEESISWKSELLRYKSIPFTELIQELEDKYQTRIIIKNKKLMKHDIIISGSFSKKQSIEQILKVISQSLPFNWTYDNGIYYIQ